MCELNEQEMQRVHDALVEAAWATPPRRARGALRALTAHYEAGNWDELEGHDEVYFPVTLDDLAPIMNDDELVESTNEEMARVARHLHPLHGALGEPIGLVAQATVDQATTPSIRLLKHGTLNSRNMEPSVLRNARSSTARKFTRRVVRQTHPEATFLTFSR